VAGKKFGNQELSVNNVTTLPILKNILIQLSQWGLLLYWSHTLGGGI